MNIKFLTMFFFTIFSLNLFSNAFNKIDLNNDGNNVLFIGRSEQEGKNEKNPLFLPNNLVDNSTKWLYISTEDRNPISNNDLVLDIKDDGFNKFAQGKFKAVITDAATTKYFISTKMVQRMIAWLSDAPNATVVIEHLGPNRQGSNVFKIMPEIFEKMYWNNGVEPKEDIIIDNKKYEKASLRLISDNEIFYTVASKTDLIAYGSPIMEFLTETVNKHLKELLERNFEHVRIEKTNYPPYKNQSEASNTTGFWVASAKKKN